MKNTTYLASITFNEVTPESASEGDFSDTGFASEDQDYSLEELVHEINFNRGGLRVQRTSDTKASFIEQEYHVTDYSTGTERSEDIHVEAESKEALDQLIAAVKDGVE